MGKMGKDVSKMLLQIMRSRRLEIVIGTFQKRGKERKIEKKGVMRFYRTNGNNRLSGNKGFNLSASVILFRMIRIHHYGRGVKGSPRGLSEV
jgi:hypothetical protein